MATPDNKSDLQAFQNLISEAHLIIKSTNLPQGRSERACELLSAAIKLADGLIETSPATTLGKRGGAKAAERGPDYYRKIAGMRKTRAAGRPRKQP